MRWAWILTVVACAPSAPPASVPVAAAVDISRPVVDASSTPSLRPPVEPVITVGREAILLEGTTVGSTREIEAGERFSRVDGLFDRLKERREAFKAAHPDSATPFRGAVSIVVEPQVAVVALMSTFQTAAYAGYPTSFVGTGDRFVPLAAQVPGPPCGGEGEPPCPKSREGYVLHAGAGDGWRLRLPREDGPVDAAGSDLPGFQSALERHLGSGEVFAIVVHLAPNARFERVSPYLGALAEATDRARLDPLTLSVRPFDTVAETSPRRRPGESSVSGRLPPEEIQRVVRGSFDDYRRCYETVLRNDPAATGRIRVDFVIGMDGKVSQVAVQLVDGTLPASFAECVEKRFRALEFPAPSGGIVTVTYPIVFTPSK